MYTSNDTLGELYNEQPGNWWKKLVGERNCISFNSSTKICHKNQLHQSKNVLYRKEKQVLVMWG